MEKNMGRRETKRRWNREGRRSKEERGEGVTGGEGAGRDGRRKEPALGVRPSLGF